MTAVATDGPDTAIYPKDALRQLANASGCAVKHLLVLAPANDPFNSGSDGDVRKAEWFRAQWDALGLTNGVHLRGVHYVVLSQKTTVLKHDGTAYENTDECWE